MNVSEGRRTGDDYVIAHEGRDGEWGCSLYQHLCGHVDALSRMESIGVEEALPLQQAAGPTGRRCAQCGQDPQPQAWRLLWRKRSPEDDRLDRLFQQPGEELR